MSGFLSEKDNMEIEWENLWKNHGHNPVYSFRWASSDYFSIPKVHAQAFVENLKFWEKPGNFLFPPLFTIRTAKALPDLFKHCIESAKISGKMLAYSLILRYPFKN